MKFLIKFFLAILIIGITNSLLPAKARAADADQTYYQCMGTALADYMNAIIDAKNSGKIPSNVHLLSPAFNMTSYTFGGLAQGMKDAGANFGGVEGIAGNVYNVAGQPISAYMATVKQQFGGPFYITETGTFDHSVSGKNDLASELQSLGPEYKALLLFNAFNTNPGWSSHSLTDDEIKLICNGSCGRIGVNSANYFDQGGGFYAKVAASGMKWTLEIADRSNPNNAVKGIQKAHAAGATPIIRIGVGGSSGGFDDPLDYASFLSQVASQAGGTIYAIAGPNEPDLERWVAPECKPLGDVTFACGGPLNLEEDAYRGEVIGLNGTTPYTLAVVGLEDTSDSVEGLASIISAKLTVTATYKHIDFKPMVDQLVGTITPGEYNVNQRVDSMKPPAHLQIQVAGIDTPGSFEIGDKPPKNQNQDYLSYTEDLFTTSERDGEQKFGTKSDIKTTTFYGCVQRSGCDPSVEKCVKAEYSFAPNACGDNLENCLCKPGDSYESCLTLGKLFQMTGEIKFEEPSDLQALERAYYNIKRGMTLLPEEQDRWSTGPIEVAGLIPDFRTKGGQDYLALYGTPEQKELYADKNTQNSLSANSENPYKATPAQAAVDEGNLRNWITAGVTGTDGSYNINYQYCIAHTSPCGLGDISSTINGTQVNIWTRSTTEEGKCLQPGWGGAPSFNDVSLPFTISVQTHGSRVGNPDQCPQDITASCTFTKEGGKVVSTCGDFVPYTPPPLDCRNCESWAPSNVCEKIQDKELISKEECVNGSCTTEGAIIDNAPFQATADWRIKWSEVPLIGWIFNLLGNNDETNLVCSVSYPPPGQPGIPTFSCNFTSRQYQVYLYPGSFIGDLNQYRSDDMNVNQAMFEIPGVTNKYFDPQNAKAPVQVTLDYEGAKATNANGTKTKPLDGDKFVFNNGGKVRTMYVSYNRFLQPQFSGWCLSRAFTNPFGNLGDATEYCKEFDFVGGGSDSQRPLPSNPTGEASQPVPEDVEQAISVAASKNNVPDILLKAILQIESGGNYACHRNYPWTATGPMQITDGTLDSITTQDEQTKYNLKRWTEGEDYSTDGRCPINQALDLGARVIKYKVLGGAFDKSHPENGQVNLNFDDVKKAARGYYGSCKPDANTAANFGDPTISYCDKVLYLTGICPTLSASCDGEDEGQQQASLFDQVSTDELNKTINAFNQEHVKATNSQQISAKLKDQIKSDLLRDVEKIANKYQDQFDPNNPDKMPDEMKKDLEQLGKDYIQKYNLKI